jgi:carboxymethylenebutenolidase
MCFDLDSSPPVPPVTGAAVEHEHVALTADDGAQFAAFHAIGPGEGPAVVVLPDVRGLYRFYEELALRLAEHGYDALAIDYFGRTAGVGRRDDEFEFWPHVERTTAEGVRLDTEAAVTYLRQGDGERAVFTLGFCFGGSNSWTQATAGHGLSGAIGFYGHPTRAGFPQGAPAVIDRLDAIECPILGLMGGADESIPTAEVDRFRTALTEADIDNEIIVYEGSPHSFFDRKAVEFADASADAWDRVVAFLAAHQ